VKVLVDVGELPSEGLRGRVVALLEVGESLLDLGQAGEVVGKHDLALHDGEVDLHLLAAIDCWLCSCELTAAARGI
jgi:hypothetical protein